MDCRCSSIDYFYQYFDANKQQLLDDLFQFLRFESISTDPCHAKDIRSCAEWLCRYLEPLGFRTSLWETPQHPTVFAHCESAGPDKPTVLIYGHYDVQPVDPLNLWKSPPFDPVIKDGEIFGRGANDDKGQVFYVFTAIRALLQQRQKLPVNIKLCIEGDEECGSPGLSQILADRAAELAADYLYIVDLGLQSPGIPAITLGCRGMISMTLTLYGANTDLHSGEHGGIVCNPNHVMVDVLSKLHDQQGKITVPGFYEDLVPITDEERNTLSFDFDVRQYQQTFGVDPASGEQEFSPLESAWIRPTLEINGISGGYSGAGFKTVIPAQAMAKISCRLVPNQNPNRIGILVGDYLRSLMPETIRFSLTIHNGASTALRTRIDTRAAKAAAEAFSEVFSVPCQYTLAGGTIPVAAQLAAYSGAETVMIGYGLPDDNLHAPNEHFGIDRMRKGTATIGRILEILGRS